MRCFVIVAFLCLAAPVSAQPGGARARASGMVTMGQALLASGNTPSAQGYFRNAIDVDPTFAEAYVELAQLYLARRLIRDADAVVSAGLRARSDHAPLWRLSSEIFERERDSDGALRAARSWRSLAPHDLAAHERVAALAQSSGAFAEALSAYRGIVDLGRRNATVDAARIALARDHVMALELIVGSTDPVSARDLCEGTAVERALARCP
jgi:tetratricopeptide (TPR) repeat protein